jgi:trimeric autotransporter adhesin
VAVTRMGELVGAFALAALALAGAGCGGGQSSSQQPPPPAITAGVLVPSYTVAGGGAFTFFVNGGGFTPSSVVQWNGSPVPTTFGTNAILTASISGSLIATPGTATITVKDPSSGAASNAEPFGVASPAAATAGVIQLITVATDGSPANADSLVAPSINSDGRYVAFQSAATNLVPGPASGFQDIYLRDTCLGSAPPGCTPSTSRISVTYDGSPTNGHSRDSSISGDGRFVAFDSQATNILPGTSICGGLSSCVFLRDTCNGAPAGCSPSTTSIAVATDGATASGGSPWVSSGGRFVAFASGATNIVSGTSSLGGVFVRDTCLGASAGCTPGTILASVPAAGGVSNGNDLTPAIDGAGRFVAFVSWATNMAPNNNPAVEPNMFVRDTCVGATSSCTPGTTRVDAATDGTAANNSLTYNIVPSISADGRLVAFATLATNLVSANVGGWANVYVRDTCAGAPVGCTPSTSLVSLGNDGSIGNNGSSDQSMSADGRFVAFSSLSSNLVPGDNEIAGGFKDIFVRDTCFGVASGCIPSTVRVSVTNSPNPETEANDISDYPAISGDGHYVVFLSAATNLVPGGTNGHAMVFLAKTGF